MVKSSAFAVIYLLASIMYCNLIWRNSYLFFAKITHGYILWTPLYNTTFFAHRPISLYHTCQKLFNFINASTRYKQKCKLVPFNLAHPVGLAFIVQLV